MMDRPIRRLNFWSVPPSSTSARMATLSYPCSSGYMNSSIEMGSFFLVAIMEIVPLQHTGNRADGRQPQNLIHTKWRQPITISDQFDAFHVQHFGSLRHVCGGIGRNLLV